MFPPLPLHLSQTRHPSCLAHLLLFLARSPPTAFSRYWTVGCAWGSVSSSITLFFSGFSRDETTSACLPFPLHPQPFYKLGRTVGLAISFVCQNDRFLFCTRIAAIFWTCGVGSRLALSTDSRAAAILSFRRSWSMPDHRKKERKWMSQVALTVAVHLWRRSLKEGNYDGLRPVESCQAEPLVINFAPGLPGGHELVPCYLVVTYLVNFLLQSLLVFSLCRP